MFQTLDSETATHIGVLQGEEWFKPKELAKQCDVFYASKGKTFDCSARDKPKDLDKKNFTGGWAKQESYDKKFVTRKFEPKKYEEREIKKFACFLCGSDKHFKRNCPKNKGLNVYNVSAERPKTRNETVAARADFFGAVSSREDIKDKLCKLKKAPISIGGNLVNALIDSGTEITVVKRDLVPEISVEGTSTIHLKGIFGPAVKCPLVYVPIGLAKGDQVNVVHQQVLCALAEELVEDVLLPPDVLDILGGTQNDVPDSQDLGLNSGVRDENAGNFADSSGALRDSAVISTDGLENRELAISNLNKVGTETNENEEVTVGEVSGSKAAERFRSEQKTCADLEKVWKWAKEGKGNYYELDGYLFHKDKILGESIGQLVLPKCRRDEVLKLAHTSVFSSHMGPKKTLERIKYSFFWEGLRVDVKKFCESCNEFQLTKTVKIKDRAPITPVSRPELPFQVVNIDLIGPIDPPSSKGHKFILSLVDQHTRWGEAVPLTSLNAKTACEALLSIFCRTGIPNVIASDNGTNFNADLTKEFD